MTVNTAHSTFIFSGDFYVPEANNFDILPEIFGASFSIKAGGFFDGINPLDSSRMPEEIELHVYVCKYVKYFFLKVRQSDNIIIHLYH